MLSKRFKLPVSGFPHQARSIRGNFITIKSRLNGYNYSRLGVIISSRYDKRAVYRNKLKRSLMDNFAILFPYQTPPGYDFLIILNKGIKSDNFTAIMSEFEQYINLLKNNLK